MTLGKVLQVILTAALVVSPLLLNQQALAQSTVRLDLRFASHPQSGLPEQDVFVEKEGTPTQVVRLEPKDATAAANLNKRTFAAAQPVSHDPFKIGQNPLGPFAKGKELGFTLGKWLEAAGSGTYDVDGDKAELKLSFQKLVPNGTYTVWCSELTLPPNVKIVDKPCGAQDGSENSFKSDASGNGSFNLKMKPLPPSTKETVQVIALAYHSDGKTYGATPGDFGMASHVQLAYIFSPSKVEPSPAVTPNVSSETAVPQRTGGLSTGWIALIGIGVIVLGWVLWKKMGKAE